MGLLNYTIRSLVDENYVYARALSYLGIDFYENPDQTLKEVCKELHLSKSQVLKAFYLFDQSHRFSFNELQKYPLEIVIEYLKYSHHLFIKEKLPFVAHLINCYPGQTDLKFIFPEFVGEFINHIYEEEDSLFKYVSLLIRLHKSPHQEDVNLFLGAGSFSLKATFNEHKDDDELAGIRNLVDENLQPDIHWQVISKEIKAFDREMWYHSEIENRILFPKSIALELAVKDKIHHFLKQD